MTGHSNRGPLGRNPLTGTRTPGVLGRADAASPDASAAFIGDTPGVLGRFDWGDPDHPAFAVGVPGSKNGQVKRVVDAKVHPVFGPVGRPRRPTPDSAVATHGILPAKMIEDPPWMKIASAEEVAGVKEFKTLGKSNPRILEYLAVAPHLKTNDYMLTKKGMKDGKVIREKYSSGRRMSDVDETPWCACFVGWCLKQAGLSKPYYSRARSWSEAGVALPASDVKVGAIVVVYRKPTTSDRAMTISGYHVGFYAGGSAQAPVLLGGNQADRVCRKQFAGYSIVAYRWPSPEAEK